MSLFSLIFYCILVTLFQIFFLSELCVAPEAKGGFEKEPSRSFSLTKLRKNLFHQSMIFNIYLYFLINLKMLLSAFNSSNFF